MARRSGERRELTEPARLRTLANLSECLHRIDLRRPARRQVTRRRRGRRDQKRHVHQSTQILEIGFRTAYSLTASARPGQPNHLVERFDAFSNRFDAPTEGFLIDRDHGAFVLEARSQCGEERLVVE